MKTTLEERTGPIRERIDANFARMEELMIYVAKNKLEPNHRGRVFDAIRVLEVENARLLDRWAEEHGAWRRS